MKNIDGAKLYCVTLNYVNIMFYKLLVFKQFLHDINPHAISKVNVLLFWPNVCQIWIKLIFANLFSFFITICLNNPYLVRKKKEVIFDCFIIQNINYS